ncbi:MAG: dTMP kinase [Victivallaceae bacterium]
MTDLHCGKFITFEGPEGAGKSTQIKMLAERLRTEGCTVTLTREPGGTPLTEKLRKLLKEHSTAENLCDRAELLLFAGARAQHVAQLIKPALQRGEIVICDRFSDSTKAYQGFGRQLDMKILNELNNFAVDRLKIDLTVLIDLPPEIGLQRAKQRNAAASAADRLELLPSEFHQRVREGFLKLAAAEPERIKCFDGTHEINQLAEEIYSEVKHVIV